MPQSDSESSPKGPRLVVRSLFLYVYVSRAKQGVRQGPRAGRIEGIVVVNSKTCC